MTKIVSDWDLKTFTDAEIEAAKQTAETGVYMIPVDREQWTSPRYGVISAPKIGDKVSYAFNGDYYPAGVITKISKNNFRKITTSTGEIFWRRNNSASWKYNQTWSMVSGWLDDKNPSF